MSELKPIHVNRENADNDQWVTVDSGLSCGMAHYNDDYPAPAGCTTEQRVVLTTNDYGERVWVHQFRRAT